MRFYKKNRDPGFQKSIPGPGSRWDPVPNADPWYQTIVVRNTILGFEECQNFGIYEKGQ